MRVIKKFPKYKMSRLRVFEPLILNKMSKKTILTDEQKEQARQTSLEVIKTILTLGFNHLFHWIVSLIKKK